MPTFQQIVDYFVAEWGVLRSAPVTFILLVAIAVAVGYIASSWYFSGLLGNKAALIEQKDAQIGRYRVALGIDKPSEGALIELTNAEMKAKAATTSTKVRGMHQSLDRQTRQIQELKNSGKLDEKSAAERSFAVIREVSQDFERTLRADAINVDNELRRRLGPKAVASIVGLPPSFFSASDGAPIGVLGLVPSGTGMSAGFLGVLANGIDQMAELLPKDAAGK
jgi:hypothetical protein